ncbi:MAG: hypothetical protein IT384_34975 [Deltaproteobacteria bacterium]|nr:hypothetical protein [Deltaproteobacteria bacterium]
MPRWLLGASTALLVSCAPARAAFLEYPPIGTAHSMLLFVLPAGTAPQAFGVDLAAPITTELVLEQPSTRFEALLYSETLADLGLPSGPLELSPEGRPVDEGRLLTPDVYIAAIDASASVSAWTRAERVGDEVAALGLGQRVCSGLEAERVVVDPELGVVRILERLPDGRALLGNRAHFTIVDVAGGVTRVETDPPLLGREATAAVVAGNGRVLIGDERGQVWEGALEGARLTATLTVTSSPAARVLWMDGARDGSSEAFLLLLDGTFLRYDGATLERLDTLALANEESQSRVLFVGPREAIAFSRSEGEIVRYRQGRVSREPFGLSPFPIRALGPIAGAQVAGETVVGGDGFIGVHRDGRWVPHVDPGSAIVYGLAPYRDGFLALMLSGVREYAPQFGLCEIVAAVGDEQRFAVLLGPLSDGAALVAGDESGSALVTSATILRPRP